MNKLKFKCIECPEGKQPEFDEETELKSHTLFEHGHYMGSCTTNIQQKKDNQAYEFQLVIDRFKRLKTIKNFDWSIFRYARFWLIKNNYPIPKIPKRHHEGIDMPLDADISESVERRYNLVINQTFTVKNYIDNIHKDIKFDKELLFMVKEITGLEPDYWINETNRSWLLKRMIANGCGCDDWNCHICAMKRHLRL